MSENHNINSVAAKTVKRGGMSVRVLSYTAILAAMSAFFNIFTVTFGLGGSMAVSFTYIPNFLAGAFLGPLPGFLTGIIGDLIGHWIAPKGAFNPIIFISSGLLGLIPGVVFQLFRKNGKVTHPVAATAISMIAILCICTVSNTFGEYLFYFKGKGRTLAAVFATRMPKQCAVWAVNACIIMLIRAPMEKLIKI